MGMRWVGTWWIGGRRHGGLPEMGDDEVDVSGDNLARLLALFCS